MNGTRQIYIVKDSDAGISYCSCQGQAALMSLPGQLDCPWCGCGWLFSCMTCRKSFTFGRAVLLDVPLRELVHRDLAAFWRKEPRADDVESSVQVMEELLQDVQPGRQYVYLDGRFFPTDVGPVRFRGWHTDHDLDQLPHLMALREPAFLRQALGQVAYWNPGYGG